MGVGASEINSDVSEFLVMELVVSVEEGASVSGSVGEGSSVTGSVGEGPSVIGCGVVVTIDPGDSVGTVGGIVG